MTRVRVTKCRCACGQLGPFGQRELTAASESPAPDHGNMLRGSPSDFVGQLRMGRMEDQVLRNRLLELLPITRLCPGPCSGRGRPAALPYGLRLLGQPLGLGYVRCRDHEPQPLSVPLLEPGPDHPLVQPSRLDLPGEEGIPSGNKRPARWGSHQTIVSTSWTGTRLALRRLQSPPVAVDGRRTGSRLLPCGSLWTVARSHSQPNVPRNQRPACSPN